MKLLGDIATGTDASLADAMRMSAAELGFWSWYQQEHGFPADRIENAVALVGTFACRIRGAKLKPSDFLPFAKTAAVESNVGQRLMTYLGGFKSVQIFRRGKDGRLQEVKPAKRTSRSPEKKPEARTSRSPEKKPEARPRRLNKR